MAKHYATVFFDWGGVIASDPGDDFLRDLLLKIGADHGQVRSIMQTYMARFMRGQISETEYWQGLRDRYGLRIHDTISEEFLAWEGLKADATILELVDDIRAAGVQVVLLTNMIEPTYNAVAGAGYFSHFDRVIASCKAGLAKPEKEIYEYALAETRAVAASSVFIDDKLKNLDPAKELGFTTILAENPRQIVRDTKALVIPGDASL